MKSHPNRVKLVFNKDKEIYEVLNAFDRKSGVIADKVKANCLLWLLDKGYKEIDMYTWWRKE